MLKRGFIKPEISIKNLGKRQFWTGIIMGLIASFVFSYFINYSRESLRSITFIGDPFILSEKEFRLYDLFFAAFSTSLGFGFTIIYWLTKRNRIVKRRYLQRFTITNAWFIIFVALMLVTRFGSILPVIVYHLYGYDNHLDILQDFWLMLVLIPVYIFFVQWNSIRLIFKTKNWILISIAVYLITTFLLFKTTSVNRNILNHSYYLAEKERFDFIDKEFERASSFGIYYSDSLKQILQKKYAERTTNLVLNLKQNFNQIGTVKLDSLILEKIVIHNMNIHRIYRFYPKNEKDKNWPYATPEDVYYQIKKHNANSIETQILFEILHEQASLFIAEKTDSKKWNDISNYEREKWTFRRYLLYSTRTIQSRLIQVLNLLKSQKEYEKYYNLLPDLKFDDNRGRQKIKTIEITVANNGYSACLK